MSTSFQTLIQGTIQRLYAEKQFVVCTTTSAGAAAGATLIDARLIDNTTDADSQKFVNIWVRIPAQTTPYWEQECIRQIGAYAPATGTLTPIDAFGFAYDGTGVTTANTTLTDARRTWTTNAHIGNVVTCGGKTATVTGNTGTILTFAAWSGGSNPGNSVNYSITQIAPANTIYEIHYEIPPTPVKECVNRSLRNMRYRTYGLLTAVTDGDMEASGITNWTATNSGLTKLTEAVKVLHGAQSSRVLNTLANGYVTSVAIPVIEGQTWAIAASCRCNVGSATLIPYDNTNAAAITAPTDNWTTDETAWAELGGDTAITIPAGCESLGIRLRGTGAADDIYWDSVFAWDTEREIIELPSWITREDQLRGVFTFPRGQEASGGGYEVNQNPQEVDYDWLPLLDESGANPFRIQLRTTISRPLYIDADRPWAELTLDTDTTNANKDDVIAGAVAFAKDLLGRGDAKEEMARWGARKQGEAAKVTQTSRWVSMRCRH